MPPEPVFQSDVLMSQDPSDVVTCRILRQMNAAILIGLVIVFGVVNALVPPEMAAGPRPDHVSMMEATAGARQPVWFLWLNPLVGAVGVWFGSRKLRE